jgi:diguanylate cyclase (GGDEF)-like protein/PAS domain S-box-containing protein
MQTRPLTLPESFSLEQIRRGVGELQRNQLESIVVDLYEAYLRLTHLLGKRKHTENDFRRLSERLTVALRSGNIGCWEWDLPKNTLIWDERMYELYGVECTSANEPYTLWSNGVHPEDRNDAESLLLQAVLGPAEYDTEFRVIRPDGTILYVKACGSVIRDFEGRAERVIGVNFDISSKRLYEKKLEELTLSDPLTGLGNRRLFERELDRNWKILQRHGIPFALIMIDFNKFKSINTVYGHHAGDVVLQDAAKKLKSAIRSEAIAARIGGDEYAVILPCSPDHEKAISETEAAVTRLTEALRSTACCCENEIPYACSVGGVVCDSSTESLEQLYILADEQMMKLKDVLVS